MRGTEMLLTKSEHVSDDGLCAAGLHLKKSRGRRTGSSVIQRSTPQFGLRPRLGKAADDPPLAFDLLMLKQKPCNEGRRVDDAADDLCAHRGG